MAGWLAGLLAGRPSNTPTFKSITGNYALTIDPFLLSVIDRL